jgi:hypothetical protein
LDSLGVTPATPHGSPLGFHSYDPGIAAGSLVFWGTTFELGSGTVDIAGGTAELLVSNVCSVFDVFTVPNSFDPAHVLGIFNANIESMDIVWSGVTRSVLGFSDSTSKFRGDFFECLATIAVSVTTPLETGHGFHFESDPATTHTNFAQFGTERNGVFFSTP